MTVLDLIGSRTDVYSIRNDVTVHDAARYLRERQVRSVGVLDADGRLVGVVSQSDISDKVAAENKCPAWMRVSEIMSTGARDRDARSRAARLPAPDGTERDLPPAGRRCDRRVSGDGVGDRHGDGHRV